MKTELPEMSRDMFLKILWERFCNESTSHHSSTLHYARLLIECTGWDDPKSQELDRDIIVQLGGAPKP